MHAPPGGKPAARVAIVTGGSRGIGRAVVGVLASRGYAVVVDYLHDRVCRIDFALHASDSDVVEFWAMCRINRRATFLVNREGAHAGFAMAAPSSTSPAQR